MKRRINLIVAVLLVVAMFSTMLPINSEALSYSGSSSYQSGKFYRALTNVQLTGNQRTDIVNIAKSQIGYQEGESAGYYSGEVPGGNNYTEYGRWYGSYIGETWYRGAQWCAMFVSWCAYVAGVGESIIDYHQYTESQVQLFKNQGRAYSWATVKAGGYTPLPGDVVYFLSSSGAASGRTVNHVGLVTGYSNGTLYTIEGNTSSAYFSTDGGCCSDKSYPSSSTYVRYICSPNYTTGDSLGGLYHENDFIPSAVQSVVFDPEYYASKNPDVVAAYGTKPNSLYAHFIDHGFGEGRRGSPIFFIDDYISKNADLNAAFGGATTNEERIAQRKNAVNHFGNDGAFKDVSTRYTAAPLTIEKDFYARIQLTNATLNLSLSETNVIAYTPSTAPAQIWHFEQQADGSYKITNTKNNLVLDVSNASKTSGANIQIYESNDSKAQRWNIYETCDKNGTTRGYILRSLVSPACVLSVASGSPTALTNVQNSTYASLDSQIFKFEITQVVETPEEPVEPEVPVDPDVPVEPEIPEVTYADIGTDFYAQIGAAVAANKGLSLSGSNVIIYTTSSAPAQLWHFERQTDGSYIITNQKTGQLLSVDGSGTSSGTNVSIADADGSLGQKWFFEVIGDYYTIIPACATDCALDIYGGLTADMTNVQIYTDNGTVAQQFSILKGAYLDVIRNEDVGNGFTAQITNVSTGLNIYAKGLKTELAAANTSAKQTFHFERLSDGSYRITSAYNGFVLSVDGNCATDAKIILAGNTNNESQKWFIHVKDGNYVLEPACEYTFVIDIAGTTAGSNVLLKTFGEKTSQLFTLSNVTDSKTDNISVPSNGTLISAQKEVLRKIIYAVETGGQVYGNADYDDFTEAYTNTELEHAITIGAGQWFATEAQTLLKLIRTKYPAKFAELDTAGISDDLDNCDWSTYKLDKGSAKANCIVSIISSAEGIACQDELMDQQMDKYVAEAYELGVSDPRALMMCVNIRHLGGKGAMTRMLTKSAGLYTVDSLYAAIQTDTGNQAGAFRQRNFLVYKWILQNVD